MPRRNRNAQAGGNAHPRPGHKPGTKTASQAPMTPFNGHAKKRRNDAWAAR